MTIEHEQIITLTAQKDGAYKERNQLVAALSKLFPASLERHPDEDKTWDDDWRWIVFIDLPTGQASWHIHDSEVDLFRHLPCNAGRVWDGHTTEEKYARLASLPDLVFAHQDTNAIMSLIFPDEGDGLRRDYDLIKNGTKIIAHPNGSNPLHKKPVELTFARPYFYSDFKKGPDYSLRDIGAYMKGYERVPV